MVGLIQRAQQLLVIIAFVNLALLALFSLSFFCYFSWACLCCLPINGLYFVLYGCYINIAELKHVSRSLPPYSGISVRADFDSFNFGSCVANGILHKLVVACYFAVIFNI
jgi:hypothetical protein